MTMPPRLAALAAHERARIELCWHEAGHAVAGILYGGRLTRSTLTDGTVRRGFAGRPSGATTFGTLPSGRHAEVAYAGVWGQARGRMGRRPGPRDLHRVMDSTGCRDRQVLVAAGGLDAGDAVVPLLERCWPSIAELAELLHRTGSVSHTDVLRSLRLSADPVVRSLEVSMIRAGAAPGSFSVSRPA